MPSNIEIRRCRSTCPYDSISMYTRCCGCTYKTSRQLVVIYTVRERRTPRYGTGTWRPSSTPRPVMIFREYCTPRVCDLESKKNGRAFQSRRDLNLWALVSLSQARLRVPPPRTIRQTSVTNTVISNPNANQYRFLQQNGLEYLLNCSDESPRISNERRGCDESLGDMDSGRR